ncbi:BURP domain protein RD22 [Euphorbia lathyris]|uniref:BURP domain protein RD22 n=1 Tax=Euphorbia lathyris TaxID=212925 RepID=UPI0033143F4A
MCPIAFKIQLKQLRQLILYILATFSLFLPSMELNMNILVVFLIIAVATTHNHAASPPQLYWDSVLPNTPMPKAVSDLLQPDFMEEKGTSVGVGKGGVNVNSGKGKPGGTSVGVGKGGVNVNSGKGKPGGTSVGVGKGGVNVNSGKGKGGTSVGVGKGGVNVHTGGRKGKPVYVGVKPGPNPFIYNYKATEDQLHDNPNVALFFLEKDLSPTKSINLYFTQTSQSPTFLPRQLANSIPFSSNKLPQIYNSLSVKPGSMEAEMMKNTIYECEMPGIKGEKKYCATSLESMIDFTTSVLGKNVQAISTEVDNQTPLQNYVITAGTKKMKANKSVVCHKQKYPYAVFYCHSTQTTRAYIVSLVGADGTKAKAVAICHTDTSAWNPKHLAFQLLKVKPGTLPVCHFLPQDHILWISN